MRSSAKKEADKRYYQKNKEKIKSKVREWTENNKQHKQEYDKQYYQNNREWKDRQNKEYYVNHLEECREIKRRSYLKQDRNRINENSRRRVSMYRRTIIERLGGYRCIKCGFNSDERAIELDHIHNDGYKERKNKVGSRSFYIYYYNHPDIAKIRLQVMCANCNRIKKYETAEKKVL